MTFKKTKKQIEATDLMGGSAKHIMLFGGSRSGKTFQIVRSLFIRACKEKSRHISLRQTFNSAKTSLWLDTIPKVKELCFPDLSIKYNRSDHYIIFPNGSEYWIGGLDDKDRVEKHLGKEFSTIHFNECSQIAYTAVGLILTRLAEKNNLKKKVYYDMNPPNKSHWSYWVFEKKLDPQSNEPVKNPNAFASMLMNPMDNIENIDDEYLQMLESLPEKEKNRFLLGQYTDQSDGQVYYEFDRDKHVVDTKVIAGTKFSFMDFNVNPMTCVMAQVINNEIHCHDEKFLLNSDTFKMASELKKSDWIGTAIPDSTGQNRKTSGMSDFSILRQEGFLIRSVLNPFVTDRTNNVNRLFKEGKIKINPKCKKLINDLEKVSWKNNQLDQKTDPMLTHISDCLGYGAWNLFPLGLYSKEIYSTRR
jgi:phage terminase large subunit